jgi:FtsP/CotA-like multicopper oxidase with cupredoxin domain
MLGRRNFLKLGAGSALATIAGDLPGRERDSFTFDPLICRASASEQGAADHVVKIGHSAVELGKDAAVSTTTYNGKFPGPLLRLKQGQPVVVDIHNDTDTPQQLHWHGQFLPTDVDGAAEEGTPFIPARGIRRISFTPQPAGFRFYHTHMMAGTDLSLGLYSGQAGAVYVEPRNEPGAYDREVFLVLKEFGPHFNRMEMKTGFLAPKNPQRELYNIDQQSIARMQAKGREPGWQIGYHYYTINGRMLGEGEPIRVRRGERVLLHILNASATELRSLHLPQHEFEVVALDGNPVPRPARVPLLWLAPAERISAIVTMSAPGLWTLGDLDDHARMHGMGIVVEYADEKGRPEWSQPGRFLWDYRLFADSAATPRAPDETIELLFTTEYSAQDGFDTFAINGVTFDMHHDEPLFRLRHGRRYRLKLRNATDDIHPLHLHRHSFELTSVAGYATGGVVKDVAMIGGFQEMTVDFTADQTGLSLFHCHMQDHMDRGFMALFECTTN